MATKEIVVTLIWFIIAVNGRSINQHDDVNDVFNKLKDKVGEILKLEKKLDTFIQGNHQKHPKKLYKNFTDDDFLSITRNDGKVVKILKPPGLEIQHMNAENHDPLLAANENHDPLLAANEANINLKEHRVTDMIFLDDDEGTIGKRAASKYRRWPETNGETIIPFKIDNHRKILYEIIYDVVLGLLLKIMEIIFPDNPILPDVLISERFRAFAHGIDTPLCLFSAFETDIRTAINYVNTVGKIPGCKGRPQWVDYDSTKHTQYVRFILGSGCWSYVGFTGRTSQDLSIGNNCNGIGVIAHEMMHAMGFFHEQSRPDRDDYVRVTYANIFPGYESNFAKETWTNVENLNSKYDYASVMHYGEYYFTNGNGKTIEPLTPGQLLGQRNGLSNEDIFELNSYYGCNDGSDAYDVCKNSICPSNSDCMHSKDTKVGTDYTCRCKPGYSDPNPEDSTAECLSEIKECPREVTQCGEQGKCYITQDGKYGCICSAGYEAVGGTCANIDECAANTYNCKPNSHCRDTVGSYTCECNAGYNEVDGICTNNDVDECAVSSLNRCPSYAPCVNKVKNNEFPLGYVCDCPSPRKMYIDSYYNSGIYCIWWDNCRTENNPCAANQKCYLALTSTGYWCQQL